MKFIFMSSHQTEETKAYDSILRSRGFRHIFNPSIIELDGKVFMSFRGESGGGGPFDGNSAG